MRLLRRERRKRKNARAAKVSAAMGTTTAGTIVENKDFGWGAGGGAVVEVATGVDVEVIRVLGAPFWVTTWVNIEMVVLLEGVDRAA